MTDTVSLASAPRYAVFQDGRCIAQGVEAEVGPLVARAQALPDLPSPLVFDLDSGEQIELPRAPARPAPEADGPPVAARPGRPRLGVVSREVTLLPQDWAWLNAQPGGASVSLRKLVLQARRSSQQADRLRNAQAACYRFMAAMAGNAPGFESAVRLLFSGQRGEFVQCISAWPADVRDLTLSFAERAFAAADAATPAATASSTATAVASAPGAAA